MKYRLEIETTYDIPVDLVLEACERAVGKLQRKEKFQEPTVKVTWNPAQGGFAGGVYRGQREYDDGNGGRVRSHPFEGPVVFDDIVTPMTDLLESAWPKVTELLRAKKAEREAPEGEGDWQLKDDDHTGEDK